MKQKLLTAMATLLILLVPGGFLTVPALAACASGNNTATDQVLNGIDQTQTSDCKGQGVSNAVSAAVSILSIVVGVAAIIMIIVSGFRYITSGGDSNRVSSAKNTLIYAVIGLAIAVIAQVLVNFVITSSTNAAHNCSSGQSWDASANKCVKN
jgi:ABC-type Fe3+ transport system permease subunit